MGEATDALISQLDLFPTICELAGILKPDWLQGYSLLPVLQGKSESVRTAVFAEINYHVEYEPMRCVRSERYKYIRNYGETSYLKPNLDASGYRSFLLEHGFLDSDKPREMLFDLYLDPVERVNLAEEDRFIDIKLSLAAKLDEWMETTRDPILDGKVPLKNS